MKARLVPTLAVLYYVAMIIFMTYPGYVRFNRIHPFVFGIPFSLFWQLLWISGAIFVLAGVFLWEKKRDAQLPGAAKGDRGAPGAE